MPLETNLNMEDLTMLDKTALTIAIIGALNWGSIGIFGFDLVAALLGAGSIAANVMRLIDHIDQTAPRHRRRAA